MGASVLDRGDTIDDVWVVEHRIGKGGMGSVYRCHNRRATRIVAAIKILDPSVRAVRGVEDRFVREAEILSSLEHGNVVRVKNVRLDIETPYIEMEFVEGRTLGEVLHAGPVGLARAVDLVDQLLDALAYLHARGIRHRDVKPGNLVIAGDDRLYVVDFGLASEENAARITTPEARFGTVAYAPPEWITPERLDPTSWDLYAAGVIFWQLLTGREPFPVPPGTNAQYAAIKVMGMKQQHDPLDPGEGVPEPLRALVRDMTHSDPARRAPSAAIVLTRLRILRAELGLTITRRPTPLDLSRPEDTTLPPTAVPTLPPAAVPTIPAIPVPPPPSRIPIGPVFAVAFAVALVVAIFGVAWTWGRREPPAEIVVAAIPRGASPALTPPSPREVVVELIGTGHAAVRADLSGIVGVVEDRGVRFAGVRPGEHTLTVEAGSCPADAAGCDAHGTCPAGCRSVIESPFVVPVGDGAFVARRIVARPAVVPVVEGPDAVPAEPVAAPPTSHPVTRAAYAAWLEANPLWLRAAPMRGWDGAGAPRDPDDRVLGVSWVAAEAYCRDRGGLPPMEAEPLTWTRSATQPANEWRVDGGDPAVRREDGSTARVGARDAEGNATTGFRCAW